MIIILFSSIIRSRNEVIMEEKDKLESCCCEECNCENCDCESCDCEECNCEDCDC